MMHQHAEPEDANVREHNEGWCASCGVFGHTDEDMQHVGETLYAVDIETFMFLFGTQWVIRLMNDQTLRVDDDGYWIVRERLSDAAWETLTETWDMIGARYGEDAG